MIVKLHKRSVMSILLRLYLCAFLMVIDLCLFGLCSKSHIMYFFPVIYWAVILSETIKSSYDQLNNTCPPKSPAPGPISITQSDALIKVSLCSTTTIVFPSSWRCLIALIAFSISLSLSPMVGSSRT